MRITNSVFIKTMLRDINKNMDKLSKIQEQMATTKRINRPSDDPVGLVDSLRLRTGLEELDKYKSNAEDARSWIEATDSALDDVDSILQRVREQTVKAANSHLTQDEFDSMNKEMKQLKQQLIQISNSTYAGRYIFSGTKTQSEAFDSNGVYQGNSGVIEYEVGAGIRLPINVDGLEAFGDMFGTMQKVIDDLSTGNVTALSEDLGELDTVMKQVNEVRADMGARYNRAELVIGRADELNVNMTELLSKAEDADIAELTMQLNLQETIYKYSLQVGARIIQPSLADYLR